MLGPVFIGIFGIGPFLHFRQKGLMPFLKRIGNVLQENQPQNHVLVFGGVHVVPQLVRRGPHFGLKPQIRSIAVGFLFLRLPLRHQVPITSEIVDQS